MRPFLRRLPAVLFALVLLLFFGGLAREWLSPPLVPPPAAVVVIPDDARSPGSGPAANSPAAPAALPSSGAQGDEAPARRGDDAEAAAAAGRAPGADGASAGLDTGSRATPEDEGDRVPEPPEFLLSNLPEVVAARLVDDATDEPIAGARALLAYSDGAGSSGWYGDTTGADGGFRHQPRRKFNGRRASAPPPDPDAPPRFRSGRIRLELRLRAPGYRDRILPLVPDRLGETVRMERRLDPLDAGTITGVVLDAGKQPFHGRIQVELMDRAFGTYGAQWTWTDVGGAYALPGIRPGHYGVRISGSGATVEVEVTGEGFVHVPLVVGPAGVDEGRDVPSGTTRVVVVTGLPGDGSVRHVRWEMRARHFFRTEVDGDEARIDRLPVGVWDVVLQDFDGAERRMTVRVPAGDGDWRVAFREGAVPAATDEPGAGQSRTAESAAR